MSLRPRFAPGAVAIAVLLASCESTSPTAPSPPFAVEGPAENVSLNCPANIVVTVNLRPRAVTFPPPSAPEFGSVSKSSCTPESGSVFPIGVTPVDCAAAHADSVRSCSFSVAVRSRTLGRTSFLAFGDSITTGVLNRFRTAGAGLSTSYPAQMEMMMTERYPDQSVTVINAGISGERTPEGRIRVSQVLDRYRPEVMLLLEGVNQLVHLTPAQVADDLESIVRSAQRRDVRVLIATLTPVVSTRERRRPGVPEAVVDLNRRILSIARRRNLGPVVDLFGAMNDRPDLIGSDGLHPTEEGYRVMAEEFLRAIVLRYEAVDGGEVPE